LKNKKSLQILVVIAFAFIIAGFYYFNLGQYLNLDYLKSQQDSFRAAFQTNPMPWLLGYFALYVICTAASLPGATILTLAAGALFGFTWGLILVSFASTMGATLAFLSARFLFRDAIQAKFQDKLSAINRGIQEDGAFYLLTLRLVPAFPFFVINLVMGLTPIRTLTYYWVSQLGMLPGTAVYVNAGTQLAQITSLKGLLSPTLIVSFALLGLMPLLIKKTVAFMKRKREQKS
jgi:uncharacterized membrane protein YdjX (TVP38/TMEM64 family)